MEAAGDEELVGRLRALCARTDAVPQEVLLAARVAFALPAVEAGVAALLRGAARDPARRGAPRAR